MTGPVSYCFTNRKAVSAKFLDYVTELTLKNEPFVKENIASPNRKCFILKNVAADGDTALFEIKQSLAVYYGLGDYIVPPILKDFIGYITNGGAIHPHVDPDLPGRRHVRVNILIRQPAGCIPVMDGIPIAIEVGDAWLNLASKCVHATTAVEGDGYRSALSFGYQIDQKRGDELYEIHKAWLSVNAPGSMSP
jgi:hypothetical protein